MHSSAISSASGSRMSSPVVDTPLSAKNSIGAYGGTHRRLDLIKHYGEAFLPWATVGGILIGGNKLINAAVRKAQPVQVVPKSYGFVGYYGMNKREQPEGNSSLDYTKYMPTPTPTPIPTPEPLPVNGTNPLNYTLMNTTNSTHA